jgi:hypothetical protein
LLTFLTFLGQSWMKLYLKILKYQLLIKNQIILNFQELKYWFTEPYILLLSKFIIFIIKISKKINLTAVSESKAKTLVISAPRAWFSGINRSYRVGENAGENRFLVMFRYTTVVSVKLGIPPSLAKTRTCIWLHNYSFTYKNYKMYFFSFLGLGIMSHLHC